jgi:hypothetical protein
MVEECTVCPQHHLPGSVPVKLRPLVLRLHDVLDARGEIKRRFRNPDNSLGQCHPLASEHGRIEGFGEPVPPHGAKLVIETGGA